MEVCFLMFEGYLFFGLGVSNSYVWWLVFLRLKVKDSYVWGFIILTFGVRFLTFGG